MQRKSFGVLDSKHVFTVGTTCLFLVACGQTKYQSPSKLRGSFVSGEPISIETEAFKLQRSKTIPHEVFKETLRMPSGALVSAWKIQFNLSSNSVTRREQKDFLFKNYGFGHTFAGLEGNEFELRDFLRPAIQAVLNSAFPHRERIERGLLGPSSLARPSIIDNFVLTPTVKALNNCWTTAYEILRNDDTRFVSFFASDSAVQRYLGAGKHDTAQEAAKDSTSFSTFVKELSWQEACVPSEGRFCPKGDLEKSRNELLQPGDYLLIYGKNGLEHAALFLDNDLYFEKTGAKGDAFLYRLVPFKEISKVYKDPNLRYRFRRLKTTTSLPHPLAAFDGKHDKIEAAVTELLPDTFKIHHRVAHQPEVNDSRDISIYEYQEFKIKNNAGKYRLDP